MSSSAADTPDAATMAVVDLRLLSQSDLYKLSLSTRPPSSSTDVTIPQINRSIFNESAASHRQTYSRFAPRNFISSLPMDKSSPSDTEAAENSRIISILKGLMSGESNDVAVEAPKSHAQIPDVGEKRKRGQPMQNPNPSLGTSRANVVKGIVVNGNPNLNPNPDPNSAYVMKGENGNNVGDVERDRERVKGKGVEVDLGELYVLEDPFRGELERLSVGLRTEEEFLGFLGGLSGQWGSKRRKRRVVDAGEFGDVLPRGWKLILSLKKKDERIWVHVRRYISPSGRHFETCKEVASYLHHIFGLEVANQPPFQQTNDNVQSTQGAANAADPAVSVQSTKGSANVHLSCHAADPAVNVQSTHGVTNVHAAYLAVKDIKESAEIKRVSPLVVNYAPDPKQITSGINNSVEIKAESIVMCKKCSLSFNGQDDLMKHKLLSHRRKRSKFGSSITDGVIIKDGLYECQFCHKTFVERHRYNGHVGAHKRHHTMNDGGSLVVSLPSSVDLGSPKQIDSKESTVEASTGDDSDSVIADYGTDRQPQFNSPRSALFVGSDKHVPSVLPYIEVNNMSHDEQEARSIKCAQCLPKSDVDHNVGRSLGSVGQGTHLAAAIFCPCMESEDSMPIDETIPIGDLAANKIGGCIPSLSGPDYTADADIIESGVLVTVADPNLQADSKIISFAVEENENACNVDSDDFPINLPLEGSTHDSVKSGIKVTHHSSFSSVSASGDQDHVRSHDVDMVSSFLTEPKHKSFSESTDEVLFGSKDIHIAVWNPETDIAHKHENNIKTGHEKSVNCLNIAPRADKLGDTMDRGRRDFVCTLGESEPEKSSEISNISIDARNIAPMEPERPKIEKISTYRNNRNAFSVGHQMLTPEEGCPEFVLPFLSGNQQFYGGENTNSFNSVPPQQKSTVDNDLQTDNDAYSELMIDFGNNGSGRERRQTWEESKLETDLLGPSYYSKPGSSENYLDWVDTGSVWDGPILDEATGFGHDKLMIGFSNSGAQSHGDLMAADFWRTDEKNIFQSNLAAPVNQHEVSSSFLPNNIQDKIDRSGESCQPWKESKQETNLLGPSYYSKPGSSENYLDGIDTESVWDGPILDGATDFGYHDKLMIGFSNSSAQSHGDLMAANFWRTDERNTFQSNLAAPENQREGSSSFLLNTIPDDKDDDMFLGFNACNQLLQNMWSSASTYPRDTKTMFNSGMAQGIDSSFWFWKDDDLSLNLATGNLEDDIFPEFNGCYQLLLNM